MISDRVGDLIVRLRNAGAIGATQVVVPHSAYLQSIALKLKELGFVGAVETRQKDHKELVVTLVYDDNGRHKIKGTKRVSKPGRRLYAHARDAASVKNGLGARILSTPKGILSDKEARKVKVGGEDLFEIW